ncbi:MAG: molybdate ABC transporter permease subunit [Halieaceae bacterium]|nr:molybdate ABC transporter permease subunit [Halieaceae bacterium]
MMEELLQEMPALWLTIKLALVTTMILLVLSTPFAYWLAHTRVRYRPVIEAIVALPIVLPPTVLGFYFLILFNPDGLIGSIWQTITNSSLLFSFSALVIVSVFYSLPFVVQPLQNAFSAIGRQPLEKAYTLGATPVNAFFSILLPLSKGGYLTAGVLGFAHTLGEFGIVLMVGGSIPNETKVASIAIYEMVESMQYDRAHGLSGILLAISFFFLLAVYFVNQRSNKKKLNT